MTASLYALTAALVLTGPSPGAEARVPDCLVSLIHDVQVPAQEAGVLMALECREGMLVEEGMLLGRIDDSKAQNVKRVAVAELKVSQEQAENDVNVRYSEKAKDVAKFEYLVNKEANDRKSGVIPQTEMKKLWLQFDKAVLQIEQAQMEQRVAVLTSEAKQASVDAATDDIKRRQILAPISGEVVEVKPQQGEWVNPGDPVLRIVQLNRLRVQGTVSADEHSPSEVVNRLVKIEVRLERGRTETFEGKVVWIDPEFGQGNVYRVWAEVDNRQEGGQWLLWPGQKTEMVIFTRLATEPERPMAADRKVRR